MVTSLALLALSLAASSAQAQNIRFKTAVVRVTVPLNATNSFLITNLVTRAGIDANGVTLTLGLSALPAGVGAILDTTTVTSNNTPVNLTVNTTNVPAGLYTFNITGGGLDTNSLPVTNSILMILQAGKVWNGSTNALNDGPGLWSDPSKWMGGTPGAQDDIIFTDVGGQTNQLSLLPSGTNYLVNSIVDNNVTIGSLRFTMTNSATKAQTLQINPTKTLAITGSNGLSFLRDYVSANAGLGNNQAMNVTILGTNATLIVSNKNANIALDSDNNAIGTTRVDTMNSLDLTWLDRFFVDVSRIGFGDYQLWPNFDNLSTSNGFNGVPRNFASFVNLARTNVIRATYVDPNNFTNSIKRDYSLCLGNNEQNGTSSTPQYTINFGISNAFFLDSICWGHASLSASAKFPALWATNYPCVAIFRGTNGGRMSMWAQSDLGQGTTNQPSGSNDKNTPPIDFSLGRIDALVDRFVLSRDRLNSSGCNAQSVLSLGPGVFDVNNAFIGYQTEDNHTNTMYCQGTLIVSNTTFRVNQEMVLGYTTENPANPNNGGGSGQVNEGNNRGIVNVFAGANILASNITVGGATKLSTANAISLTASTLTVSNGVADSGKWLSTLTFASNSVLTLHIDGNHTGPYVYTTNLTTDTTANFVKIANFKNMTFPATVPIITYQSGSASFSAIFPPGGFSGGITTNASPPFITIYLTILTNAPKHLIWRGTTPDWDTTTKNWLDQSTGIMTNYSDPDIVAFDDTPGYQTSINLAASFLPGGIAMTNTTLSYSFNGPGNITGGLILSKYGTGGLQVEASTTFAVQLNQGSLTGSGSIGGATLTPGTSMTYTGAVNGPITCAGTAILAAAGSINGALTVQSGGIVTNSGTLNGGLSILDGGLLYNSGSLGTASSFNSVGSANVSSNATLINFGDIHARTLDISGTFKDYGVGSIFMYGDTPSGTRGLTINSGGLFIPGGDGIGTTTVQPEANSPFSYPGRVLLARGSTNIFKLDPSTPAQTLLQSGVMGFGENQNTKSVNGGTIVISNVTATPFADGQAFTMFQYYGGGSLLNAGLNTTNNYPVMVPTTPGPGLIWDLSNLIPNGQIGVRGTATNPTNLQSMSSILLNLVLTNITTTSSGLSTNITTNNYIQLHLQWPSNHIGWELQQQVNPLNVGLSTNWQTVFGSWWTNDMTILNPIATNCAFFRLVYP